MGDEAAALREEGGGLLSSPAAAARPAGAGGGLLTDGDGAAAEGAAGEGVAGTVWLAAAASAREDAASASKLGPSISQTSHLRGFLCLRVDMVRRASRGTSLQG